MLKVVREVDEMCMFHQLWYENKESGLPQSTASLEASLTEAPEGAGHDPPPDEKDSRDLTFRMALAST